ncbi:MAG: TonB-dependent receptor [Acidobacteriota bacterium]
MKKVFLARKASVYVLSLLLALGSFSNLAFAQAQTTARITGTVVDQQGAVISNAEVVVRNDATGVEYKVNAGDDGFFVVASVPVGVYTVSATAQGFKQTVVKNVKAEVGGVATVSIKLEVGAASETVTVTSGAEVLEKESNVVGSTIVGRQITQLPFTSRDALDLVLNLPGTQSGGRPRQSTINGLPKAALNITLDGVNIQDTNLRASDGFFTYIRPRIDAIEEVRVTTAGQSAESAAGGAVQINFVTKGGTNEYHGGAWWYHRNPSLNSNFYFNKLNRIKDPQNPGCDPTQPGCLVETPRARVLLNQWGVKVGGPITPWLKDRAFFFFSYDEFRLPEATVRTRTILTPDAARGIFKFPDASAPGGIRSVDLLALARNANLPSTLDPLISRVYADIHASTSQGAVTPLTDPNFNSFVFTNKGFQVRRFPTTRFDINITEKHHLEAVHNFNDFAGQADFLNGVDPAFPPPIPQIFGSQGSDRFSLTTALRSQITSKLVSEFRFGLTGGTVLFFGNLAPADFDPFGGIALDFPLGNDPQSLTGNSRRNGPRFELSENVNWLKGRHSLNFGGGYIWDRLFSQTSGGSLVPTIQFGITNTDPALNAFNSIPASFRANARALYAMMTGRVTNVNINGKLDEETKQYTLDGTAIVRNKQDEYGFWGQDSFKVRDNLTLNFGLRWEAVLAPRHRNNVYIRPGYEGLFGISGVGNLFKPSVTTGSQPFYTPVDENTKPYNDDLNNFAPNLGIAWSPRFGNSWLKKIFGEGDKTVIRAGYSISYFRGGNFDFSGVLGNNPGATVFAGSRADIEHTAGSILLRNGLPALKAPPPITFPRPVAIGEQLRDFDPNIRTPYVQSWSFGIQRELDRDTALEIRYVGNRSIGLIQQFQLNEANIFENGFLDEFIQAQRNLAINRANGRGNNFRNNGLPGQAALRIFEASFGSATSGNFANANFLLDLDRGEAGRAAGRLAFTSSFQNNRVARGLAANLFIVNPANLTTVGLQTNGQGSWYNGLVVELRRRLARGLLVQGSYTWSRSLDTFGESIRNIQQHKGTSEFDIRHGFKLDYIYELPFGPGRRFQGPGGVIGKILEGWETDGIIRWQSGRQFALTCGRQTFNNGEAGCVLVGMDAKQLQDAIRIRKDPEAALRGNVFWLPEDIIVNTQRAFGTLTDAPPTGRYIGPPTTPGQSGSFIQLYGPSFFRADISLVKKTRVTETVNIEFRTEFLNAFNNINFLIGSPAADATNIGVGGLTFGQTNQAYQDLSTTNDPGGRLIQFVFRINF